MLNHLSTFLNNRIALAIGVIFTSVGIIFGTWAAFIPFIKNKFVLDEAELGLLLLTLPLGAAIMNPMCVELIRRLGMVLATIFSLLALAVFLVLPINMPTIWLVGIMLFLYGMSFSAANITMNTFASQLEVHTRKNIISTCHGLWSAGAMIGSAAAGIAQGWGVHPQHYVYGVAVVILWAGWLQKAALSELPDVPIEGKTMKTSKAFLRPNKALWLLIIIGLCVNLGEGTMADWAAVYVKEVLGTSASVASWGFATYAFFMMTGRLLGDGLIASYGSKRVLFFFGIMLTIGYLIAVFAPNLLVLLFGFSLIGLGVSLGSPILYAASSKVPGLPKGAGLAVYNTYAMIGFLGGPVFIGFLGKTFSLPVAFGAVALFSAVGVLLVRRM